MQARQAEQAGDRGAIIGWLQAFGRASGARDAEVGRWLLAAERTRAFVVAGAASVFELAERLIGWEPRTTYERLRVARALEYHQVECRTWRFDPPVGKEPSAGVGAKQQREKPVDSPPPKSRPAPKIRLASWFERLLPERAPPPRAAAFSKA